MSTTKTPGYYYGASIASWIQDKLKEAGQDGVVVSDLFQELRRDAGILGLRYKRGRYHSFSRYFHWLKQLGWVEPTGVTEPAYQRGVRPPASANILHERVRYRITEKGLQASVLAWGDPMTVLHKRVSTYVPTGRPPGRPRKTTTVEMGEEDED